MAKIKILRDCGAWKQTEDTTERIYLPKGQIIEGLVFQSRNSIDGTPLECIDIYIKGNLLSIKRISMECFEKVKSTSLYDYLD